MIFSSLTNHVAMTKTLLDDCILTHDEIIELASRPPRPQFFVAPDAMEYRRLTVKAWFGMRERPRRTQQPRPHLPFSEFA